MEALVVLVLVFFAIYKAVKGSANKGLTAMQKYEMKQAQKKSIQTNPYINYHKQKLDNDRKYREYLEWMQKNNIQGAPREKVDMFPEEREADRKIKRLFN